MSKSSFGVAPPASVQRPSPPKKQYPPRMPLEIGKAVKVKKLTPEEEKKLLEIGWKQGQAIPENLTELMERVRDIQSEATDVENMPPPTPLDTPPLAYDESKELDVSDLPPAEQKKYKDMMKQIFEDAQRNEDEAKALAAATPAGAGEGVAASIQKALSSKSDIEIEDDSEELSAKPEEKKAVVAGKTHCPRCSFPLDQDDVVVATDADRDLYLHAADSLQLFTKDFEYLNGAIKVTIRELTHQEQELIHRQLVFDLAQKRINNDAEVRHLRMCYSLTFQCLKVTAKNKVIESPETLETWASKLATDVEVLPEDTLMRKIYLTSLKDPLPDSVFRYMLRSWYDFDLLQSKLEAQSMEPDFWKPRTEGS